MRLNSKIRYAVTLLLDIAIQGEDQPHKLATLAQRQGMPLPYLERLAHLLRQKGLLKSVRGPGGGFLLARPSDRITLADVIRALDESIDSTRCGGQANCHKGQQCLTHEIWRDLNQVVLDHLEILTLRVLAARPSILAIAAQNNPQAPSEQGTRRMLRFKNTEVREVEPCL